MNDEIKGYKNPLSWLWNCFSAVGGILSLSSMVENWLEDIVAWKGFIYSTIESYRSLIEPVVDFFSEFLPFSVPYLVGDYIVFGMLYSAARRTVDFDIGYFPNKVLYWWYLLYYKMYLKERSYEDRRHRGVILPFITPSNIYFRSGIAAVTWPLALFLDLWYSVKPWNRQKMYPEAEPGSEEFALNELNGMLNEMIRKESEVHFENSRSILLWIGTYILGLVVLLSINSQL